MSTNAGGRPPKFKTVQALQDKIDEYFNQEDLDTPTISELVYFIGFADRHSFYDMQKIKRFTHTIKRARLRIETHYEKQLLTKGSTGAIFALKNFGWSDKQTIDHTVWQIPKGLPYNKTDMKKCLTQDPKLIHTPVSDGDA